VGSLREELETDQKVYVGRVPALFAILDEMPEEERQELLDVLDDRTVSSPAIHRVLAKRGYKIGLTAIKAFRSGVNTNVYPR
jgi:hypothetical protein